MVDIRNVTATGILMGGRGGSTAVYALELVGQADAFACYEAATMTPGVRRVAPGLALASGRPRSPKRLAFTRSVSRVVARAAADVDEARAALEAAVLEPTGSAAVRARSMRGCQVDTREAERQLGAVLVERGFTIDLEEPDHTLRAIFAGDRSVLGWLDAEPDHGFSARQPTERPFFQPGSMAPRLALGLVNLSGVEPPALILDPMCGTGGTLIEAGRVGFRGLGVDIQERMVAGTKRNVERYVPNGDIEVVRGDVSALPLPDGAVDGVVLDVPYGRQSKIAGKDGRSLTAAVLEEAARVSDRAVVVADRSIGPVARAAGWRVRAEFAHRVHRSLTRHVHDLRRVG